jgi:hypothetical protein
MPSNAITRFVPAQEFISTLQAIEILYALHGIRYTRTHVGRLCTQCLLEAFKVGEYQFWIIHKPSVYSFKPARRGPKGPRQPR